MIDVLAAFTLIATAIGLVRALPQLVRLLRTRDAQGVSLDSAATSSVVSAAWTLYGYLTDQAAVALASGSSAVMFALVSLAALRFGRRIGELRAAPVWLAVLLAATVLRGAGGLAVLLPFSVLLANGPQVLVAFREADLSALSLGTWLLAVAEAITWGLYGVFAGDRTILVHATLHFPTSVTIVLLWLRKRPRPSA